MFPPFSLIPQCLSKLRAEAIPALLIAPVWPNQTWFPQLLEHLVDLPDLLPPTQDILTSPDGSNHLIVMGGHLPLAAWPVSGSPSAEGLSDRVINIICKSYRTSTKATYSSAWRQWSSWCLKWQVDPLSASVKDVLKFLVEQYEMGKQYRTINTLRSAISMTHDDVDGVRVGPEGNFQFTPPTTEVHSNVGCRYCTGIHQIMRSCPFSN